VWLIGAVVCLLAATAGPMSVSAGSGWPHLHGSISSCQSTATSEIVKLAVRVSRAIQEPDFYLSTGDVKPRTNPNPKIGNYCRR